MLDDSELSRPQPDDVDVDQSFSITVFRNVTDRLALTIVVRRKTKCSTLSFDAECRVKRPGCRMLERRYHRTRRTTDSRAWVDSTRRPFQLHRSKKEEYWLSRLETCDRSSTKIWKTMSPLFGYNRDVTVETSHEFAVIFVRTIERVHYDTAGLPPPPIIDSTTSSFMSFRSCSQEEDRYVLSDQILLFGPFTYFHITGVH